MLCARTHENGVLAGLNSKGVGCDASSSFQGEIKARCWALQDIERHVADQKLLVWTDFESVCFSEQGSMQ